MAQDLLLEIGVEELPSSFVEAAVRQLPDLLRRRLAEARLEHGQISAYGTPRRIAVLAVALAEHQPDLDEEVVGPPVRVAFDSEGKPTKAALSFAGKIGCAVDELTTKKTEKGEYVAARRIEKGSPAEELAPTLLRGVCESISFKKSMRWGDGDTAFGRPVRWILALLGQSVVELTFAGVASGAETQGHRFLAPAAVPVSEPAGYVEKLRALHVVADVAERAALMNERLRAAAAEAGGELIEDDFLVGENCSLVEEPNVVVGTFEESFLALPERVILEVAKGHQRYFGVRSKDGKLLPKYLAVVNTARNPDKIRIGNDRVMRARLADAKFFYDEDLAKPIGDRRADLDQVVFQKRLGSIGDKVRRIERLVRQLGARFGLGEAVVDTAVRGAALAKCDLVSLMVGEFPELQGEMGASYARAQGIAPEVAAISAEHYLPRGADDATAPGDAGALVAVADRLDTLAGCFAIGITPTGTADPLALRRAAIGVLRTVMAKGWDLSVRAAVLDAHAQFEGVELELDGDETSRKVGGFCHQRLRGLLADELPQDVVDACLSAAADRPTDAKLRAVALAAIQPEVRALAGEVFKRAANIAKEAPKGEPGAPADFVDEVHASEQALFDCLQALESQLAQAGSAVDYPDALAAIGRFAPVLGQYFDDVFVMADDVALRENRLRLMRRVHETCSRLANFNLLAKSREK